MAYSDTSIDVNSAFGFSFVLCLLCEIVVTETELCVMNPGGIDGSHSLSSFFTVDK